MTRPSPPTAVAALLLALLAGCGAIEIADDLPAAHLGEPYEAQLDARRAKPPLRFEQFEGELPDGLTLASDGTLAGTPVGAGVYELQVLVVDANDRWTVGPVHLEVTYDDAQVYLGPVLDDAELNQLCLVGYTDADGDSHPLMCQPWVRIDGVGMPGQTERPLVPGLFWIGEDGVADGGWFDDVLLRTLDPRSVSWAFQPGESYPEILTDGPNSPDDAAVDADGLLVAGELTGPGQVLVAHDEYGEGAIDVMVVPPDFCPAPGGC